MKCKKNSTFVRGGVTPRYKIQILTLGLVTSMLLNPVTTFAAVKDNVNGANTSVEVDATTPNGSATAETIRKGYGAYVDGELVVGTMPDATVSGNTTLSAGQSVTITEGFLAQNTVIKTKDLASQTQGTATADKILSGTTAWVNGNKVTGTIPSLAAKTYTPSTANQTITSGKYLSGTQTISGDADLVSNNIKSGVNIFGVTGNNNVVDTSAGTATAAQILKDKVAYVDGSKVTGSMTDNAGTIKIASSITKSGDNALITIPSAGYYDANSKISVPIEVISSTIDSFVLKNQKSASGVGSCNTSISVTETGLYLGLLVRNYSTSACPNKSISGLTKSILSYNSTDGNGSASGVCFVIGYAESGDTIKFLMHNTDGGNCSLNAYLYLIN